MDEFEFDFSRALNDVMESHDSDDMFGNPDDE